MAYIEYRGVRKYYEECKENVEKAKVANAQLDEALAMIESYVGSIKNVGKGVSGSGANIVEGVNLCTSAVISEASKLSGSVAAMQADNLKEAKKVDDGITLANKQQAEREAIAEYNRRQAAKKKENENKEEPV